MQTILISDELPENVTIALSRLASISIQARFESPQTALPVIQQLKPELILLNLEWLCRGGESLIQSLKMHSKEVVFVSASGLYGLRAVVSVARATTLEWLALSALSDLRQLQPYKLALPMDDGWTFIPIQSILSVRAETVYTYLYSRDGTEYVINKPFSSFVSVLLPHLFGLVSDIELVNLRQVQMVPGECQLTVVGAHKQVWKIQPRFQSDLEERFQLITWMTKPLTRNGCQHACSLKCALL